MCCALVSLPRRCGPLLLAWAASRGQSLLAARACVEGALAALLRGVTFRELQVVVGAGVLAGSTWLLHKSRP
jgi:hypothetical protein